MLSIPIDTTAAQWGTIQDEFAKACSPRGSCVEVSSIRLRWSQYRDGVFWEEWLAGSFGMSFRFYPFAHVTKNKLQSVRSSIRRDRDVVHMSTHQIKVWLPEGTLAFQVKPEDAVSSLR